MTQFLGVLKCEGKRKKNKVEDLMTSEKDEYCLYSIIHLSQCDHFYSKKETQRH